jgi:hypothetical protein
MALERKISQGIREASMEENYMRSYETTTRDNRVPDHQMLALNQVHELDK